jgi:hypothetical protein
MANTAIYQQQYYENIKDRLREKAREREKKKRILEKAFVNASTAQMQNHLPQETKLRRLMSFRR